MSILDVLMIIFAYVMVGFAFYLIYKVEKSAGYYFGFVYICFLFFHVLYIFDSPLIYTIGDILESVALFLTIDRW